MNDICCECNQEIKGTKKAKIWNGKIVTYVLFVLG